MNGRPWRVTGLWLMEHLYSLVSYNYHREESELGLIGFHLLRLQSVGGGQSWKCFWSELRGLEQSSMWVTRNKTAGVARPHLPARLPAELLHIC